MLLWQHGTLSPSHINVSVAGSQSGTSPGKQYVPLVHCGIPLDVAGHVVVKHWHLLVVVFF